MRRPLRSRPEEREDREIIERVLQGDKEAFREIVLRYQTRIYNMTYRFLGNREEAEDLSQEIFLSIYRNLKNFRHESKFSTWVYRIVQNHCINRSAYLKRRHVSEHDSLTRHEPEGRGNELAERALADPTESPEGNLQRREVERIVQQGISRLQEDFRQILILRDLEGRSYDEIAEILGISLGTVKSRIHRARMSLKAQLDGRLG